MKSNGLEISGTEQDIKVTYQIQEVNSHIWQRIFHNYCFFIKKLNIFTIHVSGKLIEVLSNNGYSFKQVSQEIPYSQTLFKI